MERSKAYFYRAPFLAIYCFVLLGEGVVEKKKKSDTKTQDQATVSTAFPKYSSHTTMKNCMGNCTGEQKKCNRILPIEDHCSVLLR